MMQKCAAIIIRDRRLLVVRKKGTSLFISPGGKIESGETQIECLRRELQEEISVELINANFVGSFERPAAFDHGLVTIHAWAALIKGEPVPTSEIEEIRWISGSSEPSLGTVFSECIIPDLVRRGLIDA